MKDEVQIAITLAKRMLVDSIWKSAHIEGLGTTFPDTQCILDNMRVETTRDEVLFVLNMRDAWRFIFDNLDYSNCYMLLCELNKIVGSGLFYGAGGLRNIPVTITGTSYRPPIPVQNVIYEDLKSLNNITDAESKAVAYFCYIAKSQIFIDGNKRVAQLMCNKILIENGVGILSIPMDKMNKFTELLVNYYETDDALSLCSFLKSECIQRIK